VRYAWFGAPPPLASGAVAPLAPLTAILVLRAFSSGAVALTGIEAVADGVTAFKPPEVHNARVVLAVLGVIMVTLFVGTTVLADVYDVVPKNEETVVSQLAWQIFGGGPLYYYIQGASMLILEPLEAAQARGVPVLAEIVGFGMSADACHITQPSPEGGAALLIASSPAVSLSTATVKSLENVLVSWTVPLCRVAVSVTVAST